MNTNQRLIAPSAMVSAIVINYVCHKTGRPTLCSNTRTTVHTEKLVGKVLVAGAWGAFNIWFMPHLLAGKNQHHVLTSA